MVLEIRDWCQNVGEYNTYNFCIWHFGLCVIVSKIDRCRSSDPPYEIAINPWWRGGRGLPSLIALLYMYCDISLMQLHNTIDISNTIFLFNNIAMQIYGFFLFTLLACQRRIYSLFVYVLTAKHVTKCNNNPKPLN